MQKLLAVYPVILLAFLGFDRLNFSTAQNCAIPHLVPLPLDDSIHTECATSGTVLANLATKNIKSIRDVIVTPPNFVRVELDNNGSLSLIVDQPLYFQTTPLSINNYDAYSQKTYIDETWSQNIEAQVELECNDGRNKTVLFTIPIADKNTQPPFFQFKNYSLTMGPCYNGTHAQACPLNFETQILAFDADRDLLNSDMNFTTDRPDQIRLASSIVEIALTSKEINPNHLMRSVRVYIVESSNFSVGDTFQFKLTGYNNGSLSPSQGRLSSTTLITIYFGEVSDGENSTVLKPPVFSSKAYYAVVENLYEAIPGAELYNVKPYKISAYGNSTIGPLDYDKGYGPNPGGGDEDNKLNVRYAIQEDAIVTIDRITGKLYFNDGVAYLDTDSDTRLYEIEAFYDTYEFLPAKVSLFVFFNSINGTTSKPCTTCPECPTECPTTETTCGEQTSPYEGITNGTTVSFTTENPVTPSKNTSPFFSTIPYSTTTTNSSTTIHINATTTGTITTTQPTKATTQQSETTISSETTTEKISSTTNPPSFTTVSTTNPPVEETTIDNPSTNSTIPSTEATPPTSHSTTRTTFTSTTTPNSTTTTSTTTSSTTDTTTPPGDNCCNIIRDFECPSYIPNPNLLFPDPHNCKIFYRCSNEGGFAKPIQYNCEQDGHIFCPDLQMCVFASACRCIALPPREKSCSLEATPESEICSCYRGNDTNNNVCNKYEGQFPDSRHIPDPKYFDIFHACTQEQPGLPGLLDCIIQCPPLLHFCPSTGNCVHDYDVYPGCDKGDKLPYKCSLCEGYYWTQGVTLSFAQEY
ncbi:uncharacterized protein LOC110847696 [Folsomia candida]|uniref:uncharacterized protein LOC110847696 n=1 Tax=Folsomia candida TaxID=158441 RepID=UPI000B901CB4|nr:uncharacterized protein LOC110847696 [Folsomia candida]